MSEANTNICPSPQSSIEGFGGHEGFRRSLMHGLSAVFAFSQGPGLAHSGLWGNVEAAPAGTRATGLGSVSSKYQQFQRSPASCRSRADAAPESAEWAAIRSLAGDNRTFSNTATVQLTQFARRCGSFTTSGSGPSSTRRAGRPLWSVASGTGRLWLLLNPKAVQIVTNKGRTRKWTRRALSCRQAAAQYYAWRPAISC